MDDNQIVTTKERMVDIPTDVLNQRMKLAEQFFRAGCFGSDVKNKEQAFVKMMAGAEIGMGAMEAMNSLCIINGHITIYGQAIAKKIREGGWSISFKETPDSCEATVKKGDEEYSHTATKAEMLAMNSQAFKKAPQDKLRWHALGRILRFYIPEVMGGTVSYIKEEYEDVKPARRVIAAEGEVISENILDKVRNANEEELMKIIKDSPKLSQKMNDEERSEFGIAIQVRTNELRAAKQKIETPVEITPEPNEK